MEIRDRVPGDQEEGIGAGGGHDDGSEGDLGGAGGHGATG